MKRRPTISVCVALCIGVSGALHAAVEFSRYAFIMERRPFGTVEPVVEIAPVVTVQAPPEFVKNLRMCAITESAVGVRVGFVDIRAKPPKPYYMYIGDEEDGIQLVDADYVGESCLVRKDREQFRMYLGKTPAAAEIVPPGEEYKKEGPPTKAVVEESYAERRRKRLLAMRREAAAVDRTMTKAEAEAQLREYQMDLIRKGKTPLPIPLTEEMDAQLVREGVLPPLE